MDAEGAMGTAAVEDRPELEELLARAERGEAVAITRRGRVVARLAAEREDLSRLSPEELVRQMRKIRRGRRLGDVDLKALIDEGRE
jgi:prevent-host-death family protein